MTRPIAGLLLLAAMACGGGGESAVAPQPQRGTLIFRLDAQTCTGSGTLNFFLDGKTIGTATLATGQSTTFVNQPSGPHVAGASEVKTGGYVWPQQNVTIPAGGSWTAVLSCG